MFSIVHTTMKLSFRSRITSSSNSFHPRRLSSIRTSCIGDCVSAHSTFAANSDLEYAMPPPDPARVNDGRRMAGKPMRPTMPQASSTLRAISERGLSRPTFATTSLNSALSSALAMASGDAPSISMPSRASVPSLWTSSARLRAVWPPRVGRIAVGRSRSRIAVSVRGSSGSMYVRCASSGSVMIVAGFELTRMTSYPSSRRAFVPCVPE